MWYQVNTLGTAGALVKSVGAMGLKTNNGWGEVIAGKAATDSDKDGMPDYFEEAMGYDKSKDDAMTKESDGYVRIEKYINWLGAWLFKFVPLCGNAFRRRKPTHSSCNSDWFKPYGRALYS